MSFQQSRKGTPLDLSDLKKQAAVTIEEKTSKTPTRPEQPVRRVN